MELTNRRQEDPVEERKKKTKAAIGSITVYALLLLLFIFLALRPPEPPLPDAEGMEIVLGTDDMGMNNNFEPVAAGSPQPAEPVSQPEVSEPAPEPEVDDPESVPVEQKKPVPVKENPTPKPEPKKEPVPEKPKEETKPVRKPDPNALFSKTEGKGNNTTGSNTSKGTGDKPGDQGDPNGNPNSTSWERGSGTSGDGPGFELSGRGKLLLPTVKDNYQKEGRIVVEIVVDRAGNVIAARGGLRGTTITDPELIRAAEAAAMKAKFTPKEDAEERQYGKITYNFKLE